MPAVIDPGTGGQVEVSDPTVALAITLLQQVVLDPTIPREPAIPGVPPPLSDPNWPALLQTWPFGSGGGANARYYSYGWCTWYVARLCPWIPGGLGNADTWPSRARALGFAVVPYAVIGSVVCYGPGHGYSLLGHVAVVDGVFPGQGTFRVNEMAYVGWGRNDSRISSYQDVVGFILPPPGFAPPPLPSDQPPANFNLDDLARSWAALVEWLNHGLPIQIADLTGTNGQIRGGG